MLATAPQSRDAGFDDRKATTSTCRDRAMAKSGKAAATPSQRARNTACGCAPMAVRPHWLAVVQQPIGSARLFSWSCPTQLPWHSFHGGEQCPRRIGLTSTKRRGRAGITTVSVFASPRPELSAASFILQRQGVSPSLIGLSAAMTPIGFIVSSPLIPALARRFGAGRTALSCAALSAMLLALIGLTQDQYAWFPLRFLIGVTTNPLYVLSEIWMIALAPPARRGRIMGVYTSIISAGFAAGPLCLLVVGSYGWPSFVAGISAFVACGPCLACVLKQLPRVDDAGHRVSVLGFVPLALLLLFAVAVAAGFEQGVLALLPVYGTHYGISEARMSALLSLMIAGNITLQVRSGCWRSGSRRRRSVSPACQPPCSAGAAASAHRDAADLADVFLWGAVSYGVYAATLMWRALLRPMLIAGNAAFSLMWGLGGIAVRAAGTRSTCGSASCR